MIHRPLACDTAMTLDCPAYQTYRSLNGSLMFNPQQRYPKRWKEMSVDFKLMFVYHGSMMVLFMVGGGISLRLEILVTLGLVAALSIISIRHRQQTNWHWPGVRFRDIAYATGTAALVGFFLVATTPLFPPSTPGALPWYLAALGIGIFGVLGSLKVVDYAEADFLAHCRAADQFGPETATTPPPPPPEPSEPAWKKVVRTTFSVLFMLVWIGGVLSFYYFGEAYKNGSPAPTVSQTEPLDNHGHTVYVTPAEKRRLDRLQAVSFVGIPAVMVTALILHFIVGVKLFPNTPTMPEYWRKR